MNDKIDRAIDTDQGRGAWAFSTNSTPSLDEIFWSPSGLSYTEAKAFIRDHFRREGVVLLFGKCAPATPRRNFPRRIASAARNFPKVFPSPWQDL